MKLLWNVFIVGLCSIVFHIHTCVHMCVYISIYYMKERTCALYPKYTVINSDSTNSFLLLSWNRTAVKWQFARWTGLYTTAKLTAFWVPHMNLINSALLFLKTDCLPCASCLVTHTSAPQNNVTFRGAIINLLANLTAWQTVHIIAVSCVPCDFYGCP